jgi:hypothetical protein
VSRLDLRDAEVDDLHERLVAPLGDQEHVVRLQIAMHDPGGVRVGEPARDLGRDVERLGQRDRPASQPRAERLAAEQLHHQEAPAAVLPRVEHLHHVLALDGARGPRLAREPPGHGAVLGQLVVEHLHGDAPPDADVLGLVHGPHSAAADATNERVLAGERRPDELLRCK